MIFSTIPICSIRSWQFLSVTVLLLWAACSAGPRWRGFLRWTVSPLYAPSANFWRGVRPACSCCEGRQLPPEPHALSRCQRRGRGFPLVFWVTRSDRKVVCFWFVGLGWIAGRFGFADICCPAIAAPWLFQRCLRLTVAFLFLFFWPVRGCFPWAGMPGGWCLWFIRGYWSRWFRWVFEYLGCAWRGVFSAAGSRRVGLGRAGSISACLPAPAAAAVLGARFTTSPSSPRAWCTGSPARSCPPATPPKRIATVGLRNLL